jgi:hypothetical protein
MNTQKCVSSQNSNEKQLSAKYNEAHVERLMQAAKDLVSEGLLEHAGDDQSQPLYRDGEPVWRLTEKGRSSINDGG